MAMLLRKWNLREAEAEVEVEGEVVAGVGVESPLFQHFMRRIFISRRSWSQSQFPQLRWHRWSLPCLSLFGK